jgi:NAD(P)H dehydrogenase (quinone)
VRLGPGRALQRTAAPASSPSGRRVLLLRAHPVGSGLLIAAAERAEFALRTNGHDVRVIDLYADEFDPVDHQPVGDGGSISEYRRALEWCTDLVLAYPTWYGQMPAMLKGWFDQVWFRGAQPNARGLLHGRFPNIAQLWIVTSHGSPRVLNRLQGEAGLRFARRGLRFSCARGCRFRWVAFYGNDQATDTDRAVFLDRVSQHFRRF